MARGFIPTGALDGGQPVTHMFLAKSSAGALFIGDPVDKLLGSRVQKASAATSAGEVFGVVTAVYKRASDGRPQALTFSQPTNGPFLSTTTSGWAEVIMNPDQTYIVECDTTASTAMIGRNINGSAGTVSSAAGRSGYILDTSTISASAALPFKVVGIAPQSTDADGINGPFSTTPIQLIVKLNGAGGALQSVTGI